MNFIEKLLRRQDMLGVPVQLTISKGKTHHKTACGGMLSIIFYIINGIYFVNLLLRMVHYDDDLIVIRPYLPEFQNKTFLNETRINFIYNVEYHHPDGRMEYLNYNETVKQYIKVLAAVRDYDENLDVSLVS